MQSFAFKTLKLLSSGFGVVLLLSMAGCAREIPVMIGISKASPNYLNWLKRSDSTLLTKDLYSLPIDSAVLALNGCSALLLTGGEDVYPGWYGKESDTGRCTEMNRRRDTLDMALISRALELKMPVFAVCRGHQIFNVALEGKLIIDIPKDFDTSTCHQCEDYLHCFHSVMVEPNSLLAKITNCDSARVTTNHHQAVELLSPLLRSNAKAPDGLIEGIEWINPAGRSFLIGVQWHPERMEKTNPLSGPLADELYRQARLYSSRTDK